MTGKKIGSVLNASNMRVVFGIKRRILAGLYTFFFKKKATGFDYISFICVVLLMIIGIFSIRSAQSYHIGQRWKTQILWACVALLLYALMTHTNYKVLLRHGHWIYLGSLVLLVLVFTPIGLRQFGASRWLKTGISVQPSEIAKMGTIIMGASILARSKIGSLRDSFWVICQMLVVFLVPILLIMLQPDLGSSLPFLPIAFALLFVSKVPSRFFIGVLFLFLVVAGIIALDAYAYYSYLKKNQLNPQTSVGQFEQISLLPLKDYQRNRIISFVAPDAVDPKGVGISWNLRQSLIAIGSGGLKGKGYENGTQAKLGYLPQLVAARDFIFSVIAEEYGFLGGLTVVFIYTVLILNGLRIACMAGDRFGLLLAVGISILFMTHVCVNIGMTLGTMPVTGIPLPFISCGGSSMVICTLLQGVIQSIYRFRCEY